MRRIGAALLVFGLVACGGAAEAGDKTPTTRVEVVTDWTDDYKGEREIRVNGRPCIEYASYQGGGISCDWSPK